MVKLIDTQTNKAVYTRYEIALAKWVEINQFRIIHVNDWGGFMDCIGLKI